MSLRQAGSGAESGLPPPQVPLLNAPTYYRTNLQANRSPSAMENTMAVSEQEFGVALGRLGSVEKTVDRLERKLDENTQHTAEILRRISAIDGGWKVLVGISAIISAGIGLAIKFLPHLLP